MTYSVVRREKKLVLSSIHSLLSIAPLSHLSTALCHPRPFAVPNAFRHAGGGHSQTGVMTIFSPIRSDEFSSGRRKKKTVEEFWMGIVCVRLDSLFAGEGSR